MACAVLRSWDLPLIVPYRASKLNGGSGGCARLPTPTPPGDEQHQPRRHARPRQDEAEGLPRREVPEFDRAVVVGDGQSVTAGRVHAVLAAPGQGRVFSAS